MDGSMSRGRRLQFLVVALLFLLLPFGWYYFFYVSSRQMSLTERNFPDATGFCGHKRKPPMEEAIRKLCSQLGWY
jgi:hypothetical protein